MSLENLKCPNCGSSEVQKTTGRTYRCLHCGGSATLSQEQNILILAQRICPDCGAKVKDGDLFCADCGTKLMWPCPSCKKDISIEARFCSYCGNAVEVTACYACRATVLLEHHTCHKCKAPLRWNCPHCEKSVRLEDKECSHCKSHLMPKTYPRFFAEKFRGYGWLDTEKVSEQASALSEPLPPSSNWIVARSKVITWSENKVQTFRHLIVTSSEIVLFRGSHLFSPAQVDLVMPALDIKGILLDKKLVQINNWVISLPDKEMAQYFFDLIKYMRHSPFTEQAQDLSSGEQNSSPQSNVAPASTLVSADELSSQSSTEDRKPSNLSLHWYTGLGWTALVAVINFVAQVMIFSLLPPEAVCLTLLLMIGVPVGFLILLRRRKARALANPSNTKT